MHQPQIERQADASVSITRADGSIFNMHPQGWVTTERCNVQIIGVRHIAEVQQFFATRIVGSCSYVLRFANGGVLQYAYTQTGELLHLRFEHLGCELTDNGQAVFFVPPLSQTSGTSSVTQ